MWLQPPFFQTERRQLGQRRVCILRAKVTSEVGSVAFIHKLLFAWRSTDASDLLTVTVHVATVEGRGDVNVAPQLTSLAEKSTAVQDALLLARLVGRREPERMRSVNDWINRIAATLQYLRYNLSTSHSWCAIGMAVTNDLGQVGSVWSVT